ncbi:unnamed protein product [Hermetia illucens]|uniref:Odorant receptor n=1 Tax=Hermetia illucens TaxID=343691 RepID=A0A7R8YX61_HERIL|nr:unnamed protein product [Hermetia illucens]
MEINLEERKVVTDKSFEYIFSVWKFLGFYKDDSYSFLQKVHVAFIISCVNGITILSFIVQLFFVEDLKQLLNILPMNVTLVSCMVKFIIFLDKRRELIGIHHLIAKLDSRQLTSEEIESLENLNKFCKKIFFITFVLFEGMVHSAAVNAAFSHRQTLLFDVWMPYDYHNPASVYWATFIVQFGFFITMALENLTNDLSGPLYFIMLNRHLEIVLDRIARIGWDKGSRTQEENYQDFINCIEDHRTVLSIFDILQNTISHTLFVQFVTTGVLLSMEALLYLLYPPNPTELAIIVSYVLDITLEILPCCYYCNNFMAITDRTVTAIFSSNFMEQSLKFRKTAIIFMQMTQKSHVVVAGKVFPVTLATFMSVMKVAYSLLTVATRLR